MEINKDNCLWMLFDYAVEHYEDEAYKVRFECTYPREGMSNEHAFKQVLSWFIVEHINASGETVLEEFAEKLEKENSELAEMLRKIAKPINGDFTVLKKDKESLTLHRNEETYTVRLPNSNEYEIGDTVNCRIIPWNGAYQFWGINIIRKSNLPPFLDPKLLVKFYMEQMLNRYESMVLNSGSTVSSILNRYPAEWVKSISRELKLPDVRFKDDRIRNIAFLLSGNAVSDVLQSLPEECISAILFLRSNGWMAKIGAFEKEFGKDDANPYLEKAGGLSILGTLRRHGLAFVGKMPLKTRLYSMVYVPKDIRSAIEGAMIKQGKLL